ncbi:heterocyst differentiation ATP-binding protein HepA [Abditibacteriota bacterium]|nr:heterocyst differentiation ATP-binding protein HepA [Abditibacteriota bacterium]
MSGRSGVAFLLETIRPYRRIVFGVIFLTFLGSGFDAISVGMMLPLLSSLQNRQSAVALPGIFQGIVRLLQTRPANQQVFLALGIIVLAVLFKNAFIALSIRTGHWLSARLLADLRAKAVRLLMHVGLGFHHQSRPGDLIDKTIVNTYFVEFWLRTFIEFAANSVTLVVLVFMLFVLSWQLAVLATALATVLLLFFVAYSRHLFGLGEKVADYDKDLLTTLHESLAGIQLIKASSREGQQIEKLDGAIEAVRWATFRCNYRIFAMHPLVDIGATLAFVFLFLAAMPMYYMDSKLMLTQLFPFLFVLLRCVPLAKLLQGQKASLVARWPYVAFVEELLRRDDKPFIVDGEKPFAGLERGIELRGVSFCYQGRERPALTNISFSIPAGKITAIIGESGSGKSSLANLLLRFYDPQQGDVLVDGQPLSALRLETYHRHIGIVTQDTFLFNNTIRFNIAYSEGAELSEDRIKEAAKRAGAHDFIMDLPQGYDTLIGESGVQLSGGQRQRLAIARAILRDPEILIFDEATSSLDVENESHILQSVEELSQNRTLIIITHRLSTIKNADQVIVMQNGQVSETRYKSPVPYA